MTGSAPSFYAPIPEEVREDLLKDYLAFLRTRNGTTNPKEPFPHRERWLASANRAPVRHRGALNRHDFERSFVRFDPKAVQASEALVAILSFVKVNAGEAYGVEVVSKTRHRRPPGPTAFEQVERVLAQEETYHTKILLGATHQFDLPAPSGAWKPALPLKILIGSLAYAPKALFHPILLGSEIGGVFTFNWMLQKVRTLFKDQPELSESLEARLIEILVDEIGHVAFNRLAVGPKGLESGRKIAPYVIDGTNGRTPEFQWLGWNRQTLRELESFDYLSLPEEARRKAFFV